MIYLSFYLLDSCSIRLYSVLSHIVTGVCPGGSVDSLQDFEPALR